VNASDREALIARIGDRRVIASVSGGKDSVALWCWLLREGFDPIAVASDTGWEHDGWRAP
jgi:tRNA(Ile)-lysidine synthase TilS/MesJ